jgi:thiamine monophosphate synthase
MKSEAGADGIAVISAILKAENIKKTTESFEVVKMTRIEIAKRFYR